MTAYKVLQKIIIYLFVMLLVIWVGFPFFWMAVTSFKPSVDILKWPPIIIPRRITLKHMTYLITNTKFTTYLKNSLIVSFPSIGITCLISAIGGYSLARFKYPMKEVVKNLILVMYMVPDVMLSIPYYLFFRYIGLSNSYLGLIIAYTAISQPLALWLLSAYFQSIPIEIEEAAYIDGASRGQVLIRIVLPMSLPGIIATSIFSFINSYNDYILARTLISSEELKTLPLGIMDAYRAVVTDWGLLMSMSLSTVIPAIIFFIFIQRYLIKGWVMGAVKG